MYICTKLLQYQSNISELRKVFFVTCVGIFLYILSLTYCLRNKCNSKEYALVLCYVMCKHFYNDC